MPQVYTPRPRASVPSFARVPPQNLESEKAVLGSVMLRPEAIHEILESVSPESFYAEKHRLIWEVMLELLGKNEPIDIVSLSSRLRERGLLEQVGGGGYLAELVSSVPSAANIKYYGDTVYKKHILRELIRASEEINELGYSEHEEIENLIDQAEQRLYTISNSGGSRKFFAMKDMLAEAWERLERIHEKKDSLRGVSSGFKELDSMLSGFQKSDLIILAARPSVGKTALALDIARRTATEHNTTVAIFSLEMASQQLVDRMLAAESNVNAWHLRTGRLTRDEEFDRLRHSLDRLAKAPIFIDDQPGNNILKMRSVARRLKREKNLGLIIVDYLQLMTPINTKNSDSAVQQVTELSRSLKHLARELDVPVIALSQLSRAVEQRGGKPRLSDLRDSGSIEQDADVVMFIHREDKNKDAAERTNIAEILIEKHRNGPTGVVQLYFNGERSSYQSIDKSNFGDFADAATF